MTLDDVLPNWTYVLTDEMSRLFKAAGCDPECHACSKNIYVGDSFMLATHNEKDVMLCAEHTVKDLIKTEKENALALAEYRDERYRRTGSYGGYSRPTRV